MPLGDTEMGSGTESPLMSGGSGLTADADAPMRPGGATEQTLAGATFPRASATAARPEDVGVKR
eukprot:9233369-Pyramimonas_sp.AAC.1